MEDFCFWGYLIVVVVMVILPAKVSWWLPVIFSPFTLLMLLAVTDSCSRAV